jgi:hypothetical protein
MKELLETLNATSGDRLFGYSIVLLIIISIVGNTIVDSIAAFRKKQENGKDEE